MTEILQLNPNLTQAEKDVLFNKDTERAFTGEYDNFYDDGVFVCKNCSSPLFDSQAKFDAGCGWPAFDDTFLNAVKEETDEDGRRVEILCNTCGIHLGHVFTGEKLTGKDTRHCVNSLSIQYKKRYAAGISRLVVGCGCFWGVEHWFKKLPGVLQTTVGYAGGYTENPTYSDICYTDTGHQEVLEILYKKNTISLEKLLQYFFEIHDFEQADGQGNDTGTQYLSVIFFANEEEKAIAETLIQELSDKKYKVATTLKYLTKFWKAEEYHQDYYGKNGQLPYCHIWKKLF
jgi:peptide methionine sulfoxide reductase msrA/msrB